MKNKRKKKRVKGVVLLTDGLHVRVRLAAQSVTHGEHFDLIVRPRVEIFNQNARLRHLARPLFA